MFSFCFLLLAAVAVVVAACFIQAIPKSLHAWSFVFKKSSFDIKKKHVNLLLSFLSVPENSKKEQLKNNVHELLHCFHDHSLGLQLQILKLEPHYELTQG